MNTPPDDVSREVELLQKCAQRAEQLQLRARTNKRRASDWLMDLAYCHTEVCPLDLAALLEAPPVYFMSDCYGIVMSLNRVDKILMNGYLPRFRLTTPTTQ